MTVAKRGIGDISAVMPFRLKVWHGLPLVAQLPCTVRIALTSGNNTSVRTAIRSRREIEDHMLGFFTA